MIKRQCNEILGLTLVLTLTLFASFEPNQLIDFCLDVCTYFPFYLNQHICMSIQNSFSFSTKITITKKTQPPKHCSIDIFFGKTKLII